MKWVKNFECETMSHCKKVFVYQRVRTLKVTSSTLHHYYII